MNSIWGEISVIKQELDGLYTVLLHKKVKLRDAIGKIRGINKRMKNLEGKIKRLI